MQRARRWGALAVRPAHREAALPVYSPTTIPRPYCRSASSIPKSTSRKVNKDVEASLKNASKTVRVRRPREELNRPLTREARLGVSQPQIDAQLIDTLSLAETLEAHRQANKDSVIIRNYRSTGSNAPKRHRIKVDSIAHHAILNRAENRGSREEYEAKPRQLSLDWELIGNVPRYLRWPWTQSLDEGGRTGDFALARLSQEIRAADAYFTPNSMENKAANKARADIVALMLASDHPIVRVDPIGSRVSGLATPLSDIDLNLMIESEADRPAERVSMQVLGSIFSMMKHGKLLNRDIPTSFFAAKARVPIIVGMHGPTGLEFQVQAASSAYGSLELIKCLAAEYPTLRALFRILKHMLKMYGLAEGSRGGLTSYPLLNMIVASIKLNSTQTDPYDIGSHLLQFLDFYGNFDFYMTGITHIPSKHLDGNLHHPSESSDSVALSYYRDEEVALQTVSSVTQDPVGARPVLFPTRKPLALVHESKTDYMMTFHDPANPYNDLGRSAYHIKHIQATLIEMFKKLRMDMSEWDRKLRAEGQAAERPPALLNSLIGGDYSMYKMERKRLTTWVDSSAKT